MNIKKMVVLIGAALVLALGTIAIAGCAKTSEDVLRETVSNEFDAYKNLENATLEKIADTAEKEGLSDLGISGVDFASAVLNGFDYSIDNIEINGEAATVSVTIASKSSSDFEKKLSERVQSFVESDGAQSMSADEKNTEIGSITMQVFEETEIINESANLEFQLQDKTWVSTNASEVLANLDSLVFAG